MESVMSSETPKEIDVSGSILYLDRVVVVGGVNAPPWQAQDFALIVLQLLYCEEFVKGLVKVQVWARCDFVGEGRQIVLGWTDA